VNDSRCFECLTDTVEDFVVRFYPDKTIYCDVVGNSLGIREIIRSKKVCSVSRTSEGRLIFYKEAPSSPLSFPETSETNVSETSLGEEIIKKHLWGIKDTVIGQLSLKEVLEMWNVDRKTFEKYEEQINLKRFAKDPELAKITDADFLKKTGKIVINQHEATIALRNKNFIFLDTMNGNKPWSNEFLIDSYLMGFKKYLLEQSKEKLEKLLFDLLILELSDEDSKIIYEKLSGTKITVIHTMRKILLEKNLLAKMIRENYRQFIVGDDLLKLFE